MKAKKYNHSFARRLTRWIMMVLLVMMGALGYVIYGGTKALIVGICGEMAHGDIESAVKTISDEMSDVSVAVKNNLFDIERNLGQPDEMQRIVERIVTQNPDIRSCGISFVENYYPQKGKAYCPYVWQDDSLKLNTDENNVLAGYLEAEWFKEAVEKDSAYWSKPFFDTHDGKTPLVAYMEPIHDKQGRVVAIIGADMSLKFMKKMVEAQDSAATKNSFIIFEESYILTNDGTYITNPEERKILKGNLFTHLKDAETPGLAQEIIGKMKDGDTSYDETDRTLKFNREDIYLYYTPVKNTDWIYTVIIPTLSMDAFGMITGVMELFFIGIVLMATFVVCQLTIKRVSNPLKQLATTADRIAGGQFDADLPSIDSRDEIHMLRDSFENMQGSLARYIDELKTTTAEKASIESELKIAHDIQMSMLPKTYPAFPERHDVDIYGQLTPAKAVGGDLYDFLIHDDKLMFCIGDVSGKGVPASLVMAVTRSLFRNIAAYTQEPDRIVIALNDALSNNNETGMFVTLFMGVLDLTTGHLNYANAAHNPPLLIADGEVTALPCEPNIPAGVFTDWQYTEQELTLNPGDSIFLYTDGLNEAEDLTHGQFGMDRVIEVAKRSTNKPAALIEAMTDAVQLFVGEAEQSDDLTMLTIQYTKR